MNCKSKVVGCKNQKNEVKDTKTEPMSYVGASFHITLLSSDHLFI